MGLSAANDNRPGPLAGFMPRGLSRVQAAAYVGVSPSLFDEIVGDGRMPPAKRVNSRTIWDLRKLDVAFDALPGDQSADVNPWDLAV